MVTAHIHANDKLTAEMMAPDKDWMLSPRAMQGYLRYRLYIMDYQIDQLMLELGGRDAPPFPTDLDDTAFPHQSWTLWARLNYLVQARDSLQNVLSQPERKLN